MNKEILTTNRLSIGIHEELIGDIQYSIYEKDRIGIIGPNGSGKTTLLRTLSGQEDAYSGSFVVKGTSYYVSQLHTHLGTVGQYISDHGNNPQTILTKVAEFFDFVCEEQIMMKSLSGGQQSMIALVCGFMTEPDMLLLDEPTNHLDIHARKALALMIQGFQGSILCVSHDIWFLKTITKTLWIIEENHIRVFTGSYQEYQEELRKNEASRERQREVVNKEQKKLVVAKKRESARAARSEKTGKAQGLDRSTGRGAQGYFKEHAEKAKARNKERFDKKEKSLEVRTSGLEKKKSKKVSGSIETSEKTGALLHVRDAALSIEGKGLLSHISLDIDKGERIAIMGRNGVGKSVFMKSIAGKDGCVLTPKPYVSKSLRIEYLDQHYSIIDPEKSVLDNALDFSGAETERVRQHLSHFLFSNTQEVLKKAKTLSGGMLARLAFVMLTISPIDLLILDEPTNNLDIETIGAITELLSEYQGGLLVISHDQNFIEQLGIHKALTLGEKNNMLHDII